MFNRVVNRFAVTLLVVAMQVPIQPAASADCTDEADCPSAAQVEELRQNLELYREAMVFAQYDEAESLAKRVMELSIIVNKRESINSANALTNLAFVQHRKEQFAPAIQNYHAAIRTIETIDGSLSADLIRPLQGLGEAELAMGEIERGRHTFERAVYLSHVNEGPRNADQIESLNIIAETYFLTGSIKNALDVQTNIYSLKARTVGFDSAEFIPAVQHHAEWMSKLGLYNRARLDYLHILKLQETYLSDNDPNMIPTLIALGVTPYNGSNVPWDTRYHGRVTGPDHYLNRVMRIANNQPHSNWELTADTALAVGDYYTRMGRFARARYTYSKAWQQLSAVPEGLSARREKLEQPLLLENPYLPEVYADQQPSFEPIDTERFSRGTITAEFDVTASGKTANIHLIESQPSGLTEIEARLIYALKYLLYRPRMEDGLRVATGGMTYSYEFFYRN